MTTTSTSRPRTRKTARPALSRERIVQAGLDYVDEHGLEALSLHKLGESLGVRAMSLYNHIDGKDDLLSGIVDLLWSRVEQRQRPDLAWRDALEHSAREIRAVMLAHPAGAALLMTRSVVPVPALRAFAAVLDTLRAAGFSEQRAYDAVRLFSAHAMGCTMAELCLQSCGQGGRAEADGDDGEVGLVRQVAQTLPADVPGPLFDVALKLCGECDMENTFELGLQLMLRGLEPDAVDGRTPAGA